jgi:hypothetical protein
VETVHTAGYARTTCSFSASYLVRLVRNFEIAYSMQIADSGTAQDGLLRTRWLDLRIRRIL